MCLKSLGSTGQGWKQSKPPRTARLVGEKGLAQHLVTGVTRNVVIFACRKLKIVEGKIILTSYVENVMKIYELWRNLCKMMIEMWKGCEDLKAMCIRGIGGKKYICYYCWYPGMAHRCTWFGPPMVQYSFRLHKMDLYTSGCAFFGLHRKWHYKHPIPPMFEILHQLKIRKESLFNYERS